MLTISAKTIYIDPKVRQSPTCRDRLERMLPHIRCEDIHDLDEEPLRGALYDTWHRVSPNKATPACAAGRAADVRQLGQ